MNKKVMRSLSIIICIITLVSCLCGCDKDPVLEKYDNYSMGLDDDGFYEGFNAAEHSIPDFSTMSYGVEDVLEFAVKYTNENEFTEYESVEEYVYDYGNEFLITLDLAVRDTVCLGDFVSAKVGMYEDDKLIEGYETTKLYTAEESEDPIINSFVGHSIGDKYDVQYTFPEDNAEMGGKTVTAKIEILNNDISDPIKEGIVEANLDEISKYVDGVSDTDSYLKVLRSELAKIWLEDFIDEELYYMDVEVPQEYIEHEIYRFKSRVYQIGYSYEEYLIAAEMTEEDVIVSSTENARKNIICMVICKDIMPDISEEDVKALFGNGYEYIQQIQGGAYLKLCVIRDKAISHIASLVKIESDTAAAH